MATVKLVASAYTRSNSNYVIVTNPSYMYDDTSDTSDYATIRGRAGRSSNSTYYCYLHGFNFSAVPSNATVTAFTVKIKGYRNSYQNTGSSYRVRLCGSATNSAIASTTTSTDWDTTVQTITIPTGSLTWSDITGYGSGFSIQLRLRNTSTSSSYYPYLYIYGAEIEVTYTVPVTKYETTVTTQETDVIGSAYPFSQTSGNDTTVTIRGNLNALLVTDNGVDITSSLVYKSDTFFPNGKLDDAYTYTISNISAHHTIVISHTSPNVTYTVSVSSSVTGAMIRANTVVNTEGTSVVVGTGRDAIVTIYGLTDTTGIVLKDNGTDVTSSLVYVEPSGDYPAYYYYYLSNVTANHTIVLSDASVQTIPVRVKQNGSWVTARKVLVKQNGSWVEGTIKVKQNGNWN